MFQQTSSTLHYNRCPAVHSNDFGHLCCPGARNSFVLESWQMLKALVCALSYIA